MDHGMKAAELFLGGYNCAQSVVVAFCDLTGLEPDFAAKMASSFGGGMGRMREVCGAVSGMLMVSGLLYGYETPGDDVSKKEHYVRVLWDPVACRTLGFRVHHQLQGLAQTHVHRISDAIQPS